MFIGNTTQANINHKPFMPGPVAPVDPKMGQEADQMMREMLYGVQPGSYHTVTMPFLMAQQPSHSILNTVAKQREPNIEMQDRMVGDRFRDRLGGFNADYYIQNNPDVANALGMNPKNITDKDRFKAAKHYERFGREAGRKGQAPIIMNPEYQINQGGLGLLAQLAQGLQAGIAV